MFGTSFSVNDLALFPDGIQCYHENFPTWNDLGYWDVDSPIPDYVCKWSSACGSHDFKRTRLEEVFEYDDGIQGEESLIDNELYVVVYHSYAGDFCGLYWKIDFGITKEQVIKNVLAHKYAEGATYFTIGAVLHDTFEASKEGLFNKMHEEVETYLDKDGDE